MDRAVRVATCIYNPTSITVQMLQVFVYSVLKNTKLDVIVYASGLMNGSIKESDRVQVVPIDVDIRGCQLPARKISIWRDIAEENSDTNLILCDNDMLMLRDPSGVFEGDADFYFTVKDNQLSKYRLNTGVVFARNCSSLFKDWESGVEKILSDHLKSRDSEERHGAADQCWLADQLNQTNYFLPVDRGGVRMQALRSSIYNLHKDWSSVPENCRMIHFKSNWSLVVTHGDDYYQAMKSCGWDRVEEAYNWKPCFELWREHYREMVGVY